MDVRKVNVLHNSCLGKICNIFWTKIVSNEELYKNTGSLYKSLEIGKRRLRWLVLMC